MFIQLILWPMKLIISNVSYHPTVKSQGTKKKNKNPPQIPAPLDLRWCPKCRPAQHIVPASAPWCVVPLHHRSPCLGHIGRTPGRAREDRKGKWPEKNNEHIRNIKSLESEKQLMTFFSFLICSFIIGIWGIWGNLINDERLWNLKKWWTQWWVMERQKPIIDDEKWWRTTFPYRIHGAGIYCIYIYILT